MIEKLKRPVKIGGTTFREKINELVDAVNGILAAQEQYATIYKEDIVPMLTPENEIPADPYAEQQKWVGRLCRFWDNDGEEECFSILEYIDKNSPYVYCASGDWRYKHCEPVKPDDDIIYKGDK